MLGTGGKHQQQLSVGTHGFIAGRQQQLANLFSQRCAAGFAGQNHIDTRFAQTLSQILAVSALARAFGAFQGNKQASHRQLSLINVIAGLALVAQRVPVRRQAPGQWPVLPQAPARVQGLNGSQYGV